MPGCRWLTLAELQERHIEWRRLAAGSEFPTAFSDPAWILAWWRHYGGDHEPWSLALEARDGSLRGLALLACRQSPLARTLMFAGHGWNGLDTLIAAPGAEADLTASLLDALAERRAQWDVWRVGRLPTASLLARSLLDGAGPLRAAAHDLRLQPFLELPADVETFERRFGAKQRNTRRRKLRRLIELGAVPHLVSDPEEARSSLLGLLELRRRRAAALGQRYKHMDARFESFILEAVRGLLPDGARLWVLELGGEMLASRLDLLQGPCEHSYLLGLGETHPHLSPGSSLEWHAIQEAIRQGRSEFELGPGRDAYKYRLRARDRELARLVVASGSVRGSGVTRVSAADLWIRNTAAADALRRRRGLTPERASSEVSP